MFLTLTFHIGFTTLDVSLRIFNLDVSLRIFNPDVSRRVVLFRPFRAMPSSQTTPNSKLYTLNSQLSTNPTVAPIPRHSQSRRHPHRLFP